MIITYDSRNGLVMGSHELVDQNSIWTDLVEPTPEEASAVETAFGIQVPSYENMVEIEASSRLIHKDDMLVMTAPILSNSTGTNPKVEAITFILKDHHLITIRYTNPRAITDFLEILRVEHPRIETGEAMLLSVLEAIVDRMADVLEQISIDQDEVSRRIFHERTTSKAARRQSLELDVVMRTIGRGGDVQSKVRDTLVGLRRLVSYLPLEDPHFAMAEAEFRVKTLGRDINSLSEYADQLGNKISFLLNATLGMISIQQNNIIKFFSVVAVLLMPPTLVASIYGMNFEVMPELSYPYAYPIVLGVMFVVALIPYYLFKRKGWL